jgi:hypothetical protein
MDFWAEKTDGIPGSLGKERPDLPSLLVSGKLRSRIDAWDRMQTSLPVVVAAPLCH